MVHVVFNDAALQEEFATNGYVVLPNILSAAELTTIKDAYLPFEKEISQSFHTSHFSADVDYKATVQQAIFDVVYPHVKSFVNDYIPVFANLMIKHANPENFLQMHADWTYVDETQYRSISVWIPFVDTTAANGCFGVIEKSHQFMNAIRGPGIQQNNFKRDRIWVKKYGKLVPVKAGDAIVFDHSLLHYSLANTTTESRPALNLSMAPKNAPLLHYCIPEGADKIEKYTVEDPDFFLRYVNWQRPQIGTPVACLEKSSIEFIDEKMENYGRNYLTLKERWVSFLKEKIG